MNGKSKLPKPLSGRWSTLATGVERVLHRIGLGALHPRAIAKLWLNRVIARATVCAGPFAGMKYVRSSVGSVLLPKLLGTYERELQPIVEQWCRQPNLLVVDVGAAEGYYAVGLTHRCPTVRCIAFEAEAAGRALIQEMARANGVEQQIDIRGFCTPKMLTDALAGREEMLVIMDVEGAETELLDPVAVPALTECSILVELHPQYHAGIIEQISTRFAQSHQQRLIHEQTRSVDDLPFGRLTLRLFGRWLVVATAEYRPVRMAWLWMQPLREAGLPNSEFDTPRRSP